MKYNSSIFECLRYSVRFFRQFDLIKMLRRLSTVRSTHSLRILGIETSCDDTAAAVVDSSGSILSQSCRSQLKYHQPWGGVVPSIAKNHHYENLVPVISEVMDNLEWNVSDLIVLFLTNQISSKSHTHMNFLNFDLAYECPQFRRLLVLLQVLSLALKYLYGKALTLHDNY